MDLFSRPKPPDPPLPGRDYLSTLHRFLRTNFSRLAPTAPPPPTFFQQSYTLLTLGLDPSSQPLSRSVKVPLTLGFGSPTAPKGPIRPLVLRLPPDRLLYLLLRWQALPQNLPHVGRTDVPIAEGVPLTARGAAERDEQGGMKDGDVQSVRSWVGSMRSVSLGSVGMGNLGKGWWGKEEPSEDQILLALYSMFTVLPALLIHPPFASDRPIAELVEAGGYTQFGPVDVRVPLDALRNLTMLELEGYDPRALLIPLHPNIRSLTVRDVQDGDDWIEELLVLDSPSPSSALPADKPQPRFPHLRNLRLISTSLLSFPSLPLTSLTSLDLSYNLLNAIPTALSSLSSLSSLNLSHNVITSVRNAPSCLGNISTLNISHNRLDCLVGLERVMGLERVDVRANELEEVGEVGRLAVLPHIKEVWAVNNPFDAPGQSEGLQRGAGKDEWRVELGTTFAMEGRKVLVDDKPFSWGEQRGIDTHLERRGRSRPRVGRENTIPARPPRGGVTGSTSAMHNHATRAEAGPSTATSSSLDSTRRSGPIPSVSLTARGPPGDTAPSQSTDHQPVPFRSGPPPTASAGPSRLDTASSVSATSTPTGGQIQKKRRPRRVIDLDSAPDIHAQAQGREVKGGSMRLPPRTRMLSEDDSVEAGMTGEEDRGRIGVGRLDADADERRGRRAGPDDHGSGNGIATGAERGEGEGNGGVVKVKKAAGRRARVSASMFEPH